MARMGRPEEFEGREAAEELAGDRAMIDVLLVAGGGCLGAISRYGIDAVVTRRVDGDFPWAILVINVVGAFALGLLTVAVVERGLLPGWVRPAAGIGFLGAFTTFSTFAAETFLLAEAGQVGLAATYVLATNVVGIGAGVAGFLLGRAVLR
jgi:CrcB protein